MLYSTFIPTPLGTMVAIADEQALYLLEFTNHKKLEYKKAKVQKLSLAPLTSGTTAVLILLEKELAAYFAGTLKEFTIPLHISGTDFQKQAWHALTCIPYGHTTSYAQQATIVGKPTACRAVANANGSNNFPIIIPCHRVVASTGSLGGYSSGIHRKQWLLKHERSLQS